MVNIDAAREHPPRPGNFAPAPPKRPSPPRKDRSKIAIAIDGAIDGRIDRTDLLGAAAHAVGFKRQIWAIARRWEDRAASIAKF